VNTQVKLSILQISDLHRDPANPIRNDVLLTSLHRDRDRYTSIDDPRIRKPDIIIVSGDVVQGVMPGTADFETLLRNQYIEAKEFLVDLAERFVEGDRSRVIIIPGNHDIDACMFTDSLESVAIQPDRKKELVGQLFSPGSRMRWSWQELALYRIANEDKYAKRLQAFASFYTDFYEGKRTYALDPAKQFDIFDYPDFDLTIAGFSSCHDNDILNTQGTIHPSSIAGADKELRDPRYLDRLRLAAWHHNTEGAPSQTDYMPAGVLQNLIDCGFSIGFHGHQHRPQFIDTRFEYGADRRMTVISAGTLCGSAAFNHGRAYNVIELDTTLRKGVLHVREAQNAPGETPIWCRRAIKPDRMVIEFDFDPPPQSADAAGAVTQRLLVAEGLMEAGEHSKAAELLLSIQKRDRLARPLLLDCLTTLKDSSAIAANFDPPESSAEAIALMDALWETDRTRLQKLISSPLIDALSDASVTELQRKYLMRLK
jgi:3',5'-cyclic AMP phosphodiesterase CpdA